MARKTKAQKCIEANLDLLVVLDGLASQPKEACRCGSTDSHKRCAKCGACNPSEGHKTMLWANYRTYAVYGCGECGAKANMYSQPVYEWHAKPTFAAGFGAELAGKIRRGWAPSEKQIALAHKLAAEGPRRTPKSWERPAITWAGPKGRKTWSALVALVAREAFGLTPDAVMIIENSLRYGEESRETVAAAKEIVSLIRKAAAQIIEDRTGYAALASVADYADAMKAAADDKILSAALHALLDGHNWLVREKRIDDTCPAHLAGLRSAVATGDKDAAVVLQDAIQESSAA